MSKKNNFTNILYFNKTEFDSPDVLDSGLLMDSRFISRLDRARHLANTPFIINSGYRTKQHNKRVNGSNNSSHLKGLAADINTINIINRFRIVNALLSAGFDRIGIHQGFIHVDLDNQKSNGVIWLY